MPDRVARSVARLTQEAEVRVRYPIRPHTFVSTPADSRKAVVSYWRKYVHEMLVNRLGCLSLPRKSVVKLTDRPDFTVDVEQQYNNNTVVQFLFLNALMQLE